MVCTLVSNVETADVKIENGTFGNCAEGALTATHSCVCSINHGISLVCFCSLCWHDWTYQFRRQIKAEFEAGLTSGRTSRWHI